MATKKKNFTTADGAIDKFFTTQTQDTNKKQTTKSIASIDTNAINANVPRATNKSKHYDERGKRAERFGLLLDEKLKGDLKHLSMATCSKSINDFIVTVLIEYIERDDNQKKLKQYRKLIQ